MNGGEVSDKVDGWIVGCVRGVIVPVRVWFPGDGAGGRCSLSELTVDDCRLTIRGGGRKDEGGGLKDEEGWAARDARGVKAGRARPTLLGDGVGGWCSSSSCGRGACPPGRGVLAAVS
jgi:hypothetical protein